MFKIATFAAAIAATAFTMSVVPAAADATGDAVWAELQSMDSTLSNSAAFSAHIDYSDEGGLTEFEVRALVHHFDAAQTGALEHACNHIRATPRSFLPTTVSFCEELDDVMDEPVDNDNN